jgi:hypothetical protein
LGEYEKLLYNAYSKGQFDNAELTKTWTFFNSMFFCGTIYTTIGELKRRFDTFEANLIWGMLKKHFPSFYEFIKPFFLESFFERKKNKKTQFTEFHVGHSTMIEH